MHLVHSAYQLHHAAEGIAALEACRWRRKMIWRTAALIAVIAVVAVIQ